MAKKIQISAGTDQYIHALYSAPSRRPKKDQDDKSKTKESLENSAQDVSEEPLVLEQEKTLVLMAHGFPGHSASNNDLYGDLESILAEKSYDTLRFDFRGCGKSDAMAEDFTLQRASEDFKHVLYWAAQEDYAYFIFVGEGFGATLSVMNLIPKLNATILLWPIVDLNSYYKLHFANEQLDARAKSRGYIERDGQKYGLNFIKELKAVDLDTEMHDLNVPALVMHGAQDDIVTMEHTDMLRDLASSKRIEITVFHDGEHGLQKLNHRKMMFHHITQFIEKYN